MPRAYMKARLGLHKGYPDELTDHTWEAVCPFCEKVCRHYAGHAGWWCKHYVETSERRNEMVFERPVGVES